jgi:hypothetical protein
LRHPQRQAIGSHDLSCRPGRPDRNEEIIAVHEHLDLQHREAEGTGDQSVRASGRLQRVDQERFDQDRMLSDKTGAEMRSRDQRCKQTEIGI